MAAMIVTTVHIKVKPEFVDRFIEASIANHQNSTKEPLNCRFDILQHEDDPTQFTFYEAYRSKEGAAAHRTTAHYLKWRDEVAPWMAEARCGIPHRVIAPTASSQW